MRFSADQFIFFLQNMRQLNLTTDLHPVLSRYEQAATAGTSE